MSQVVSCQERKDEHQTNLNHTSDADRDDMVSVLTTDGDHQLIDRSTT